MWTPTEWAQKFKCFPNCHRVKWFHETELRRIYLLQVTWFIAWLMMKSHQQKRPRTGIVTRQLFFFSNLSQRERLSEIKPPLQNQLCMQRRIFQENNPLLSQNTKSQSDDDFLGCCPSPVYLILGSSWDPLVPDPAFDRHFPSYWMDKCKTSSMIAKCGKIFCSNFVQGFYFKILIWADWLISKSQLKANGVDSLILLAIYNKSSA